MSKEKELIQMICDKCGKKQEPDPKQSTENWDVFPNEPCECGGKYKPELTTGN